MDHANTLRSQKLRLANASGEVILFFDDDLEITPKNSCSFKGVCQPEVARRGWSSYRRWRNCPS
jgi:hypothetical protein